MFRRQFDLQQIEEQAARDASLLACLVYVRSWKPAPDIIDTPTNTITFLKDIMRVQTHQYRHCTGRFRGSVSPPVSPQQGAHSAAAVQAKHRT